MAIQQQECEVRQRTITTNELSLASETLSEKDDKDGRIKGKLSSLLHAWSTQIHRFMTDWWWWELLSWSISFLSVSAIVALLINYNEKAQPEKLFLGITINAYIAIFAGIGKAALVLPVSEAIGQLKWTWFRAEARLWDFFAIDIASRGPLGSIMLMGRSKCRDLVSVGAAITILALAFEPFFQQIVTYPTRSVLKRDQSSFVSAATKAAFSVQDDAALEQAIDGHIKLQNPPPRTIPAQCPTGICTFPEHSSLAICHRCEDISRILQYSCSNDAEFYYPRLAITVGNLCGYTVNSSFVLGTQNISSGTRQLTISTIMVEKTKNKRLSISGWGRRWNTTAFLNITDPILDFYVAYIPQDSNGRNRNGTQVLLECALSWCVQTFRGSFIDGVFQETVYKTSTRPRRPTSSYPISNRTLTNISRLNETRLERERGNTSSGAVSVVKESRSKNITVDGKIFIVPSSGTTHFIRSYLQDELSMTYISNPYRKYREPLFGIWTFIYDPPHDFNSRLATLATEMTNVLRVQKNGTEKIYGTVWGPETYVRVRWAWLTLPLILLFASLAFLVATIITSRKHNVGVLKNSALATMLYGMTPETRHRFDGVELPSEVETESKGVYVKLSEDGLRRGLEAT